MSIIIYDSRNYQVRIDTTKRDTILIIYDSRNYQVRIDTGYAVAVAGTIYDSRNYQVRIDRR